MARYNGNSTRYNLRVLPKNVAHYTPEREAEPDKVMWSGRTGEPPAIGERVTVKSDLGHGEVRGYFIEDGFLGVYVRLFEPPAWWKKQMAALKREKKAHRPDCTMVFGAELREG